MASFNKVIIVGNLTRDPEVKYLPSGMAVAELGVAINDSYKNKEGEMVERTVFVDVDVWGKQAETSSNYLSKGSPVLIEGKLQMDSWETKDGEKRNKMKVRADRVQFLPSGGKGGGGGGGESRKSAPKQQAPASKDAPPFQDADDDLPF